MHVICVKRDGGEKCEAWRGVARLGRAVEERAHDRVVVDAVVEQVDALAVALALPEEVDPLRGDVERGDRGVAIRRPGEAVGDALGRGRRSRES